ncbi:MAG: DnaB-like helicase N-terminal domain-containing protein, partial [Pseudomonadota bacterium]
MSVALEKGLPVNVEAERVLLGSIVMDESLFVQVAGTIEPNDFS